MPNLKYKYNPETLSYEEVALTLKDKLLRISYFAIVGIVVSTLVMALFYRTIQRSNDDNLVEELQEKNAELLAEVGSLNKEMDLSLAVLEEIQQKDDKIYRATTNSEPYPSYKREFGTGGNPKLYAKYAGLSYSELVTKSHKKLDALNKKLVAQSKSFDEVVVQIKKRKDMILATPSIMPVANKDLTRTASGFGMRTHPIYKIQKMHTGMDFTASPGTDIYCTADGVVEKADWMNGYGQTVVVNHGFGYKTLYAHTSAFKCKPGQKVKRGDLIALVGNTGLSSGPHLHYEVRKKMKNENGKMVYKPVNPASFYFNDLSPEEFNQMLELSRRPTQSM